MNGSRMNDINRPRIKVPSDQSRRKHRLRRIGMIDRTIFIIKHY